MELIDISQEYKPGMKRYRSTDDFRYEWLRHYDKGSGMALSRLIIPSHLGTHIDSPYHFFENGRKTGDIPLETLCGMVRVIDATGRPYIDGSYLKSLNIACPRLLFRTDNTERLKTETDFEYVFFTADACEYLVSQNVLLVGTDYFNVDERGDKERKAHMVLLKNQVVILEGVVLDEVPEGEYELYCLPLKVSGLEGAPCRALLKKLSRRTGGSEGD